ncbi:STAS domain-containing protein [Streptacidiphilus pinicola]|nr:STAS domain-containing protein [Streptacidiphilus pinicola]
MATEQVNGFEPEAIQARCSYEAVAGVLVYSLAGDLDVGTDALALDVALTGFRAVVVDLAEVGFFGSAALNALLGLRRRAAAAGLEVHLSAVPPAVTRILALTGTDRLFPTHEDVNASLPAP